MYRRIQTQTQTQTQTQILMMMSMLTIVIVAEKLWKVVEQHQENPQGAAVQPGQGEWLVKPKYWAVLARQGGDKNSGPPCILDFYPKSS